MKKIDGILIAGQMYSGKSVAADYLVTSLNYKKFSFARSLKEMAGNHYNEGKPISKAESYPVYIKETSEWIMMNGRDILAKLGEAIKHGFDYSWFYVEEANFISDFFQEQTDRGSKVEKNGFQYKGFVMDDNRFEEEYLYFKDKFNVKLVYVESTEETQVCRAQVRDGIIPTQDQLNSSTEQLVWAEKYADIRIVNEYSDERLFFLDLWLKVKKSLNA